LIFALSFSSAGVPAFWHVVKDKLTATSRIRIILLLSIAIGTFLKDEFFIRSIGMKWSSLLIYQAKGLESISTGHRPVEKVYQKNIEP